MIINQTKLMEYIEGDMELLQDSFDIFQGEVPTMLTDLKSCFDNRDVEGLQSQAHMFKGMLANFMAEEAYETIIQIESIDSEESVTRNDTLLNQLSRQVTEVEGELARILKSEVNPG